jgi:hypothetical protein
VGWVSFCFLITQAKPFERSTKSYLSVRLSTLQGLTVGQSHVQHPPQCRASAPTRDARGMLRQAGQVHTQGRCVWSGRWGWLGLQRGECSRPGAQKEAKAHVWCHHGGCETGVCMSQADLAVTTARCSRAAHGYTRGRSRMGFLLACDSPAGSFQPLP